MTPASAANHPERRRFMLALAYAGELSPVEWHSSIVSAARALRRPDPNLGTVSYHVRTLARLGYIEEASTVQRRGALEHRYRLAAGALERLRGELEAEALALEVRAEAMRAEAERLRELVGKAQR